ncbi:MAG: tetratricopeptide repeat protein [Actinomycetota bacterium]|nr:tetratricopeptide repeat protein [Actinomycetota bacterium]
MSDALAEVARLVHAETGVVIREPQMTALAAALGRLGDDMDADRFLGELAGQTAMASISRLIDEVTVKETYFLRELRDLGAVDWHGLLARARAGGSEVVRVWVSACATGEEAYSLAMLASEALGSLPPVSVLATDISPAALQRAEAGRYTERSMRNVSAELRERYFVPVERGHAVRQSLKSLVRIRRHNLVADPSPPAGEVPFDVIACRNVLIYFDTPTVEQVIGSLEMALRPEGHLILGAADRLCGTAVRLGSTALDRDPIERRRPRPPKPALRRPLGLEAGQPAGSIGTLRPPSHGPEDQAPRRRVEDRLEQALEAADRGDIETAIVTAAAVIAAAPLNADAYFVRGLAELRYGDHDAAATSFRRALYVDPSFSLAAFELGRAHDARRDLPAARRAYEQALRTLDPDDDRHRLLMDQVDLADIAAACRARLVSTRARARAPR